MGYSVVVRAGLFIFECARFGFLTEALAALNPDSGIESPWLLYAVPNALFPLMALFLWLDFSKYRAYGALYKAGKCMCVFAAAGWFFAVLSGARLFADASVLRLARMLLILLLIDLLTVIAAAVIFRKKKKNAQAVMPQASACKTAEQEDFQCE